MTRRLPHLLVVLIAVAAMLPAVALAARPKHHHKYPANCQSAVCVYYENSSSPNGSNGGGKGLPLSAQALAALNKYGGKDKRTLEAIATSPAFGIAPAPGGPFGDSNSPGTFLAALDLGAGPIALFATLFAGAAAFGAARELRRRRAARHA